MSTIDSDGFVVESSNPNAEAVRESLDVGVVSPSTSETVARPATPAPEREADRDAATPVAADPETPETPDSGRERGADGKYTKKADSVQARIDKAIARQRDAERERDTYRAQLESYRTPQPAPQPQGDAHAEPGDQRAQTIDAEQARIAALARDPNDPEPQLSESEDYEKWVRSVARWEARQERREDTIRQQEYAARQQFDDTVLAHTERIRDFATKQPDYFEKIDQAKRLPVSAAVEAAMISSPDGPAWAYFLATHPEDAVQLAQDTRELPATAAAVARRLLQALVHATPTASNGSVAGGYRPTVSAPIKPVGSAPVTAETSPDEIPFGPEYVERMNALERKKAQRRI